MYHKINVPYLIKKNMVNKSGVVLEIASYHMRYAKFTFYLILKLEKNF